MIWPLSRPGVDPARETLPGGSFPAAGNTALTRWLIAFILLSLVAAIALIFFHVRAAARETGYLEATREVSSLAGHVARSALLASLGKAEAFPQLKSNLDNFNAALASLLQAAKELRAGTPEARQNLKTALEEIAARSASIQRAGSLILGSQSELVGTTASTRVLNDRNGELLDATERLVALLAQADLPARAQSAAARMSVLSQQVGKNANLLLGSAQPDAEATFALVRDMDAFHDLLRGLSDGKLMRLSPQSHGEIVKNLEGLRESFRKYDNGIRSMIEHLPGLAVARTSGLALLSDSEALTAKMDKLTASYQEDHHPGAWPAYAAAGCGLAAAVCALLLLRARSNDAVWHVYEREHTERGAVTQANTLLDELRRIARRVSVLAADVDTRAIAAAAKLADIMKRLQQQHRQVVAEMEQNAQVAEEIRRADEARKALAGLEEVTKQLSNLAADIRAEADAQVATADNLAARVEKLLTTAGRGAGATQYSVDPANQETGPGVERKPVAGKLA